MLRELELLRAKKPLIVSMGDVAASGGYYIACKADSIFANTNTITGSIGVFSMFANLTNTLKNKLGITFDGVKTAPYADFPSPMRPLTDAERDYFQRSVDTFYQTFLSRVAAGRNMSKEQVHDIAQGRVWTGALAKQLGLVDEIGNLDRAINSAVAMAKLKDYSIDVYPKPTDKLKFILNKMSDNVSTEVINGYIASKIGQEQYTYFSSLHQFIGMNGKVMALAPFTITVK
jgi:protease-4